VAHPDRGFLGQHCQYRLAGSAELKTTVMRSFLRAVSLLGINTSTTPREIRLAVLEAYCDGSAAATSRSDRHPDDRFRELPAAFPAYIQGGVVGRTVVKISLTGRDPTGE